MVDNGNRLSIVSSISSSGRFLLYGDGNLVHENLNGVQVIFYDYSFVST